MDGSVGPDSQSAVRFLGQNPLLRCHDGSRDSAQEAPRCQRYRHEVRGADIPEASPPLTSPGDAARRLRPRPEPRGLISDQYRDVANLVTGVGIAMRVRNLVERIAAADHRA